MTALLAAESTEERDEWMQALECVSSGEDTGRFKEGILGKMSKGDSHKGAARLWKQRWFVLDKGMLAYYTVQVSTGRGNRLRSRPVGCIDRSGQQGVALPCSGPGPMMCRVALRS
jgi:hypothetical protein